MGYIHSHLGVPIAHRLPTGHLPMLCSWKPLMILLDLSETRHKLEPKERQPCHIEPAQAVHSNLVLSNSGGQAACLSYVLNPSGSSWSRTAMAVSRGTQGNGCAGQASSPPPRPFLSQTRASPGFETPDEAPTAEDHSLAGTLTPWAAALPPTE